MGHFLARVSALSALYTTVRFAEKDCRLVYIVRRREVGDIVRKLFHKPVPDILVYPKTKSIYWIMKIVFKLISCGGSLYQ